MAYALPVVIGRVAQRGRPEAGGSAHRRNAHGSAGDRGSASVWSTTACMGTIGRQNYSRRGLRAAGDSNPAGAVCAPHEANAAALYARYGAQSGLSSLDNAKGVHAGAAGVRYAASLSAFRNVLGWSSSRCDQIRVAEFVPGVPCSVIGMCIGRAVVVFEPIEIMTVRMNDTGILHFAGTSAFWRPDSAAADALRDAGRTVGAFLRDELGFGGMYSLDGSGTQRVCRDGDKPSLFGGSPVIGLWS